MSSPKEIINRYAIKPRKKLGQSFLIDQNVIRKISAIAQVTNNDIVVEIGSGIGVITEHLAQSAAKLIAVEVDDKLVEVLKDKLLKYNNVQICCRDILKLDFSVIAKDGQQKIKVVGNVINYLDTNTKEQTCLKECLPLGCKITEINCIKSNSENCIRICNITQPKFVDDFIEKNFKK